MVEIFEKFQIKIQKEKKKNKEINIMNVFF